MYQHHHQNEDHNKYVYEHEQNGQNMYSRNQ